MQLNTRERRLAIEALERLDPDTVNDDFINEGYEETSGAELDELVRKIRHGEADGEDIEQVRAAERASEDYWDNKP